MTGDRVPEVVHVLQDLEPFLGLDGRVYSLRREDVATLPQGNALVLQSWGAVQVLPVSREVMR